MLPPPPLPPPPPPPPPPKDKFKSHEIADLSEGDNVNGIDAPLSPSPSSSPCFERKQIHASKSHEEIQTFALRENDKLAKSNDSFLPSSSSESNSNFLALYSHVQPILQNGPLCGLVALAMAETLLLRLPTNEFEEDSGDEDKGDGIILTTKENEVKENNQDQDRDLGTRMDPDKLLAEAVKAGYSRKGEMFSAQSMLQLVKKCYPQSNVKILDTHGKRNDGSKNINFNAAQKIRDYLIDGNFILIPYDADFNHGPALRNGHSAHWALLHGIAILVPNSNSNSISNLSSSHLLKFINEFNQDSNSNSTQMPETESDGDSSPRQTPRPNSDLTLSESKNSVILGHLSITQFAKNKLKELLSENGNDASIYAIGHQGKSVHVGIWDLDALIRSNQNLRQISPKIMETQEEEPLILCDIENDLCSKMVIIKRQRK